MLKLFYTQNILKHFVQLLFSQYTLGWHGIIRWVQVVSRLAPIGYNIIASMLFVMSKYGIKLIHPWGKHRLFAKTVYFGQTANSLLDIVFKNVAEIRRRATARQDHFSHSIRFQKHLIIRAHCIRKRLIRFDNVYFVKQKRVEVVFDLLELLFAYFSLSSNHISRLLCYKRISDTPVIKKIDTKIR